MVSGNVTMLCPYTIDVSYSKETFVIRLLAFTTPFRVAHDWLIHVAGLTFTVGTAGIFGVVVLVSFLQVVKAIIILIKTTGNIN
jgi:hypothetical protein